MATRDLPPLDLLKGFESAARHLSFTRAGAELFLTQSAISRQVQALEEQLGAKLFRRKTRALALTEPGRRYFAAVRAALDDLRTATAVVRAGQASAALTVTTTVTFASLWLVPRLAEFQAAHPDVQVRLVAENRFQDLVREGIDVAVRYCPPAKAGDGAVKLFGERVLPVASPALVSRLELAAPADLARAVLLEYDDVEYAPWLSWRVWFETLKVPAPKPAGLLRFSHYDQIIQAAVAGHGVALGRVPLVDELLRSRRLAAPFGRRHTTPAELRAYFVILSPLAAAHADALAFVEWLRASTGRAPAAPQAGKPR